MVVVGAKLTARIVAPPISGPTMGMSSGKLVSQVGTRRGWSIETAVEDMRRVLRAGRQRRSQIEKLAASTEHVKQMPHRE